MLQGKKGVVIGVANKNSIAWAIAKKLHEHGAKIAFNFAGERLEKNVRDLAAELDGSVCFPCDVTDDNEIHRFYHHLRDSGFDELDFIIHSVAFARREELQLPFLNSTREGFHLATDISSYSLQAMVRAAMGQLNDRSSIVTLSYIGSERYIPNYNVMGVAKAALESSVRYMAGELGSREIRVNAISAGPIKTLAARGIKGFTSMLEQVKKAAPLKRNVTVEEVANTALFLVSDLSSGITGERIHVDAGYHAMGMG